MFGQYSSSTSTSFTDTTTSICNTQHQNQNCWMPVAGSPALSKIAVGVDGVVVGLKTDGTLAQYDSNAKLWSALPTLPGATQVALANRSTIYAIANSTLYTLTNGVWSQFSSQPFSQVAVGGDGDLWTIGTTAYGCGNTVYHYSSGSFVQQTQGLSQISVETFDNVFGLCSSIASPSDNLFHYNGTSWSSFHGWLSQVAVAGDALWGVQSTFSAYHQAPSSGVWDSITGIPSYIASSNMLATFGIFSNQLEQFQSYVLTVSRAVSGQYNGSCPPGYGGAYQPPCSSLMHTALARLQIQGHATVVYGYSGVYNQYLSSTATDSLTPQETFGCANNGPCPSITTGGNPNTGEAGVLCAAMGWFYEDTTSTMTPVTIKWEIAKTKVIGNGMYDPSSCKTIYGATFCKVPVSWLCTPDTTPPDYKPTGVYTEITPPMWTKSWQMYAGCIRGVIYGVAGPWVCTPGAALRDPDTISNALCTHNP